MSRRKPSYPADTNASGGGGGGTPSGLLFYESPAAPQFSRWFPEIYLPLDASLADAGPKNRTVTTFGVVPPTFAADSPFGSGQCLQVNPDGSGAAASGLSVAANLEMQMSYSSSAISPFSLGMWFKSAAPPSAYSILFSTPIYSAWGSYGKLIFIDTSGRLRFQPYGVGSYVISSTNLCDGAWHLIIVELWDKFAGLGTDGGSVFFDGAYVGKMWFTNPGEGAGTASVKGIGQCDTTNTYLISDFWYQNAPAGEGLASLLWNGGSGRRFNDRNTGLIEVTRT